MGSSYAKHFLFPAFHSQATRDQEPSEEGPGHPAGWTHLVFKLPLLLGT